MSEGWINCCLADLLTLEYGSSLPESDRQDGHVPVYGSNGVVGTHNKSFCSGPGIVVGRKGSVGQVCWSEKDFWPIDTTYFIKLKNSIELRWMYWRLLSCNLAKLNSSTGVPGLNRNDVYALPVSLPLSIEQRTIATILDTMDEAIRQTEAVLAKLRQVKTGMLHDLLTRGLDENGELRDPLRHPEQFNKTSFGTIPKKWKFVPLENIAEISSGITLGNTPQGAGTIELPYLRVANVQDGYLDLQDIKKVRIYKKDIDRFALRKGDVLMNEGGDFDKLGRGAIWEGQIEPCLHQNHVFRVRPFPNSLNSYFLDAVSSSPYGKGYFLLNSKQSTNLASINSTQLKGFPVPCPGLSEQLAIVTSIAAFDRRFLKENDELLKLQQLKQGLLHDLLTGHVRIPPHLLEATS